MTAIVVVLLGAVALPVFGQAPVTQPVALVVMAAGGAGRHRRPLLHELPRASACQQPGAPDRSSGQQPRAGLFVFDSSGVCGAFIRRPASIFSKLCRPARISWMFCAFPKNSTADFKDWLDILFMPNHALGFDDVVKFLPQFFPHSQGRRISLMYRPIHDPGRRPAAHVSLIATDQTEEYEAQERARAAAELRRHDLPHLQGTQPVPRHDHASAQFPRGCGAAGQARGRRRRFCARCIR